MSFASLAEALAGLVLASFTLRDVFHTAVVPGESRGHLRIARRLVFATLPLWKRMRPGGVSVEFAPLVLVASFAVWMALLILAFGLMAHAVRGSFVPALADLGDGLYVAGSSMTTIGFGSRQAHGPAAVVAVLAGFCGLAVMTLAVTYLLQVQGNIATRDTGVLRISTAAGQPPCALVLLERYARLDCRDELLEVLQRGREWCAVVLQSHASHPSLIYFRSARTETGWPAALGTLMDLALIADRLIEWPQARGPAALVRSEADRLAQGLGELLRLQPAAAAVPAGAVDALLARLAAAGYSVRRDPDVAAFLAARSRHVGPIHALSEHLGTPSAPLLPGAG